MGAKTNLDDLRRKLATAKREALAEWSTIFGADEPMLRRLREKHNVYSIVAEIEALERDVRSSGNL
jgi:hypothetical protein